MQHILILPGKRESVTLPEVQVRCHEKPLRSMAAILDSSSSIRIMYQLCLGTNYGFRPPKKSYDPTGLAPSQTNTNPGGLFHLDPAPTALAGGWEG